MESTFYLWLNDEQVGPYETEQLIQWLSQSPNNKNILCWTEGMSEWKSVGEIFAESNLAQGSNKDAWSDQEYLDKVVDLSAKLKKKAGNTFDLCYRFASKKINQSITKKKLPELFEEAAEDGVITEQEESFLRQVLKDNNLSWEEACSILNPKSKSFIREVLADAISDGVVTEDEQNEIIKYMGMFMVHELEHEVMSVIRRTNVIYNLENGILPQALPSHPLWLKSGEAIYFESSATFLKEVRGNEIEIFGRLYLTNTRFEFLSDDLNLSKKLTCIRSCEAYGRSELQLNFSPKTGSGSYYLEDAQVAEAYVIALTKSNNRTGTLSADGCTIQERRQIPKEVRHAVWIRDGAKCVECQAEDYLEFDHIIPVSKGGSNAEQNIQLLCRRCNGKKSNRI